MLAFYTAGSCNCCVPNLNFSHLLSLPASLGFPCIAQSVGLKLAAGGRMKDIEARVLLLCGVPAISLLAVRSGGLSICPIALVAESMCACECVFGVEVTECCAY